MKRPVGSNADEWVLFLEYWLDDHLDQDMKPFLAVQICEAIEVPIRAIETAVVATVGGAVEGRPTSAVNYLQRLRQLVDFEASTLKTAEG